MEGDARLSTHFCLLASRSFRRPPLSLANLSQFFIAFSTSSREADAVREFFLTAPKKITKSRNIVMVEIAIIHSNQPKKLHEQSTILYTFSLTSNYNLFSNRLNNNIDYFFESTARC